MRLGENAENLAAATVEATGRGVAADKTKANRAASLGLLETFAGMNFVDPVINAESRMIEIPRPAGVITVLLPEYDPVAPIFSVGISALLSRNAVVFIPAQATHELAELAVKTLSQAAEAAGAPVGSIRLAADPSPLFVNELVTSGGVSLVLDLRDPWSSPELPPSPGPRLTASRGNTPVYVDASAELSAVTAAIVKSKAFDYGLLPGLEQLVFVPDAIAEKFLEVFTAAGSHFASAEEVMALRTALFGTGSINPDCIGKSAAAIAKLAGFKVKKGTKIILAEITDIGVDEPLSREKPCPVLAFRLVRGVEQGFSLARALQKFEGAGHVAVIHADDPGLVLRYAATVNAYRVIVNGPASGASLGDTSCVATGFMSATGYAGGQCHAGAIGPAHMVHWTVVAWPDDKTPAPHVLEELRLSFPGPLPEAPSDGVERRTS